MTNEIFKEQHLDTPIDEVQLFHGPFSGILRFDRPRHPQALTYLRLMQENFWRPEVFPMGTDRTAYQAVPEQDQRVFVKNLLFQNMADSLVPSALENAISSMCSDPAWAGVIQYWAAVETSIHAYSYSYIIRNLYANPSPIFDEMAKHRPIIKRFLPFIAAYETASDEEATGVDTLRALVHSLCLENIAFHLSFAVTFSLAEIYRSAFANVKRIIQLILFDEEIHAQIGATLIRIINQDPWEASITRQDVEPIMNIELYEILDQYAKAELDYMDYLVQNGFSNRMLQDPENLQHFVNWRVSNTLKLLRRPIPDKYEYDPQNELVVFYKGVKNPRNSNPALQEAEGVNYRVETLQKDW